MNYSQRNNKIFMKGDNIYELYFILSELWTE